MPNSKEHIRFPPFELDAEHAMLYRRGHPIDIHATPMRLLVYLAQHRSRIVPKSELLAHVWSDAVVSETVVSSALNELRRALNDDGALQKVIRTERGRGYQFVGENQKHPVPSHSDDSLDQPNLVSIAVLPFIDMSADRDHGHIADGLTEEITNELVHVDGIRVAARTSCFVFKETAMDIREIGTVMGVEAAIEGSIRTQADRVRVCAQLVRTSDGFHLWSNIFERDASNIIGVEIEIAESVASALKVELASIRSM
jgi:TolB-like protein